MPDMIINEHSHQKIINCKEGHWDSEEKIREGKLIWTWQW